MTKFDYTQLSEVDMIKISEQIPLNDYANMGELLPRYAQGLFDEPPGPGMRRKRRKLADFNPDEKTARRKLKNRIAAQTARDRKRIETEMQCEKLSETKEEVTRLRKDNESLRSDNASLRDDNARLRQENAELRQKLELALSGRSQSGSKRKRPKYVNLTGLKTSHEAEKMTICSENESSSSSSSSSCSDPHYTVVNPGSDHHSAQNQKTSGACLLMQSESVNVQVASPCQTAAIQESKENTKLSSREKEINRFKLDNLPPKKRHLVRYTHVTARLYKKQDEPLDIGKVQAFYQLLLTVMFQATSKILSKSSELEVSPETAQDTILFTSKSFKYQQAYLNNSSRLNRLRQKYSQSNRPQDAVRAERLSMVPSLPLQPKTLKLMNLLNPVAQDSLNRDQTMTTASSTTCSPECSRPKSLSSLTSIQRTTSSPTLTFSRTNQNNCPVHQIKELMCLACKSQKMSSMSVETLRQINLMNYVLLSCKRKQELMPIAKPRETVGPQTASRNVQV